MVREELVAAINNALDKGESLQGAMQTLISAGYELTEVQEAARAINTSVLHDLSEKQMINDSQDKTMPINQEELEIPSPNQQNQQNIKISESGYKQLPTTNVQSTQSQEQLNQNQPQSKKKFPKIIIFLIIIAVLLIIGLMLFILFGEQILAALFSKA